MLVVGWITVVSAALNLLTLPATLAELESMQVLAGADWPMLVAGNVLAQAADLAFWSWAIYELQMNAAVREAFVCRSAASEPARAGPAKG